MPQTDNQILEKLRKDLADVKADVRDLRKILLNINVAKQKKTEAAELKELEKKMEE